MKIVIENRKTRYLLKKEGLYYALLTNTPSAKNEPKLLHEYGFSPDQVVGRQQVLWQKKVEVNFDFAYKLVEKKYKRAITKAELQLALEDFYGPIKQIIGGHELVYWFNSWHPAMPDNWGGGEAA